MFFYFLLLICRAGSEELPTAASLIGPRDYTTYEVRQFLEETSVKPTKKGPVLFPNDGPPAPKPPLIVTSRPLIESIARSELSNFTAETQLSQAYQPYLTRVKEYQPYGFKSLGLLNYGNYDDLEDDRRVVTTNLPPIYKVFSDYANRNLKEYQPKIKTKPKKPVYSNNYINNHINDDYNNEDEKQNYAFSYKVRDQKTGDDFSHSQHSSGSATSGEYRVRLPDGRMQIVSYTADENGYKADVRYDDEKTEQKYINNKHIQYNHDYNYKVNNNNFANDVKNEIVTPKPFNQYNPIEDYSVKPIVEHNNDITKDDYINPYSDSKEYYSENTVDYDNKNYDYEPHQSKYSSFLGDHTNPNLGVIAIPTKSNEKLFTPTVRPTYEELKPLFVQRKTPLTPTGNYNGAALEISAPSTTSRSASESNDNERVVLIGSRPLYTNIKQHLPISVPIYTTPRNIEPTIYTTPKSFIHPTNSPREYLFSTIASLRDKLNLSTTRPILSDRFLERINKYLKF